MAGCTISPLVFTMAMEVIRRASKWAVGGERLQDSTWLPPIRAYMDDIMSLTTTAPCTHRLLAKLKNSLKWARMTGGNMWKRGFHIDGEVIPSIVKKKPVKSLGRWYNSRLSGRGQVSELREFLVEAISTIDKTRLKWSCLQAFVTRKVAFDCV